MIQTNLYSISGTVLALPEIQLFTRMLQSVDHTYSLEEGDDEQVRTMLDMLVLTGLIERFVDGDGDVMDLWVITDEAIAWVLDPQVQADISVANTVFDMQVQA